MAFVPSVVRLLIIIFVALGSLTYGYSSSIIGAINGLFQTGGFIGTLCCYTLADWLGRRKALMAFSILTTVGNALQAEIVRISMYLAMRGRGITGIGIGTLVTPVPLYQSEIAPPRIRGLLVDMHSRMNGTGYMITSWVGLSFYIRPTINL